MNESDEESSSESSSSEDEDSTDNVRTTTKDIREEPPIVPVIRNASHKAWILEKDDNFFFLNMHVFRYEVSVYLGF